MKRKSEYHHAFVAFRFFAPYHGKSINIPVEFVAHAGSGKNGMPNKLP